MGPLMMKKQLTRRIQETGSVDVLYVNVPSVWARLVGVQKGDHVTLEMERDGALIIRPQRGEDHGRAAGTS